MKRRGIIILVGVLGLVALLLAGSSVVASPPWQEPDSPDEAITAAAVGEAINYQGRLTDSGGNPLTGTYDFQFQFYDSATDGTLRSNSGAIGVTVTDGLFNTKIPVDQSDFDGQALWLQVRARPQGGSFADWMTPRQEILPAPYALSLRPGAIISGAVGDENILHVDNTATGPNVRGLYAHAEDIGIHGSGAIGVFGSGSGIGVDGRGEGTTGIGVRGYSSSGTAIAATGTGIIQSAADTTVWVPGSEAVVRVGTSGLNLLYHGDGIVRLDAETDGSKQIVIPISVPAVLYGQPVRVEQIGYTYKCKGARDSHFDEVKVYRHDGLGNSRAVLQIFTDRDCTDANWYSPSYSFPTDNVLSADDGILTLEITAWMEADPDHDIWISGVKVRLGHDD